ncbi:putative PH-like domain superfamily, NECAP, PHear domain-containing protein [Helianthus annuus]|nr:putative PH-like domain superfamily, NECAP, PHear domain-containing protein [Helianthus annuus]
MEPEKHAFVGLGFTERNEAFDFNVALSDHEKYVKRESKKDDSGASDESCINTHPAVNHRLKLWWLVVIVGMVSGGDEGDVGMVCVWVELISDLGFLFMFAEIDDDEST